MQRGIVLLTIVHRVEKGRIFKKGAVLNFFRNSCELLIHDAPRAHVQMSHLGIAHLAVRQSYRHATGISLYERIFRHQFVHYRRLCQRNRVALRLLVQAVAVQNH